MLNYDVFHRLNVFLSGVIETELYI